MANRISTAISVAGVLAGVMLLVGVVREYRAGASALWAGLGAVILLAAVVALVRDLRCSRGPKAAPPEA
ncbi:hypothetical protein ABTX62_32005 [Streptomyces sp. NPDC096046]|uniref:hypothetical protein n=1 Tax=Streptomyces sp. NPDC096046 TaxID=3155542 RepID=UPI0033313A1B